MALTVELTLDEINLVVGALSKLPYEVTAPVINKIGEQVRPQLAAMQEQAAAAAQAEGEQLQ